MRTKNPQNEAAKTGLDYSEKLMKGGELTVMRLTRMKKMISMLARRFRKILIAEKRVVALIQAHRVTVMDTQILGTQILTQRRKRGDILQD